jgi:ubiquinone biosynthesis O-methyltransferase
MLNNSASPDTSDAYNSWHLKVHGNETTTELHLQDWHRNALKLSPEISGLKVLEVGCGAGDFAIHLASRNAEVTAVDFSRQAIVLAEEKAKAQQKHINFQVADAQALPFNDGTFDLIFSCECLEHIPDPQKALAEFNRVLKSSGKLLLTTENYSNAMLLYWIACWYRREPFNSGAGVQPIEHFFVFWQVKRMFKRAGLRIQKMTGSHHVFLMLPRCHPHTFVVEYFQNSLVSRLARPLARHMTFLAVKE